jgi:hypothetical protein
MVQYIYVYSISCHILVSVFQTMMTHPTIISVIMLLIVKSYYGCWPREQRELPIDG